jgi:X-Pro dipeptidyl-peptidase
VAGAITLVLVLLTLPSGAAAQGGPAGLGSCSALSESVVSEKGDFGRLPDEVVEIPSKLDGRPLQIGVVRPDGPAGYRAPVIVLASPYLQVDLKEIELAECNPFLVENFVQHGYAVAFVPTRGTANTDGCANLFGRVERSDLDDALTWLGTRPWSNGSVAMHGLSYDGSTPWAAAATGNPYLKTILPASGVNQIFDLVFGAGTYDWRWWLFVPGYYHYYAAGFNNPLYSGRDADRTVNSVTTCPDADAGLQATAESFATAEYDSRGYWAERDLRPLVERNYRGSVLLIQGLTDWNVRPAHTIPWTVSLQRRGTYVRQLLGQWGHALPDMSGIEPHARWDFADIALAWFDYWLKGKQNAGLGPGVEVEDSSGRWRREESWPPPNAQTLYLTSDGKLADGPGSGQATALLGPDSRSRYYYTADGAPTSNTGDEVRLPAAVDELCATCAVFRTRATRELRISGLPELSLEVTPTAGTGHVTAFLYRKDAQGLHRLGFGETDLRFPRGENRSDAEAAAITPGAPLQVRIEFEPLEAVVPSGQELLLVVGQGHSSQAPSRPPAPVRLRYGSGVGTLDLALVDPPADSFFTPPPAPPDPAG